MGWAGPWVLAFFCLPALGRRTTTSCFHPFFGVVDFLFWNQKTLNLLMLSFHWRVGFIYWVFLWVAKAVERMLQAWAWADVEFCSLQEGARTTWAGSMRATWRQSSGFCQRPLHFFLPSSPDFQLWKDSFSSCEKQSFTTVSPPEHFMGCLQ